MSSAVDLPALDTVQTRDTASRGWSAINGVVVTCVIAVALIGTEIYASQISDKAATFFQLLIVTLLTTLVAYGELASRYRDHPIQLFSVPATDLYIVVNIAAGVTAFGLIQAFGVFKDSAASGVYQVLLASFGAVGFFRSSLFTARVGGSDIAVGPNMLLQSLLGIADRQIDRDQAQGRAVDVAHSMADIDFDRAKIALPALCMTLVENITADDQKSIETQIATLASTPNIDSDAKSIILGVYLVRQVGADVLQTAVDALKPNITKISAGGQR